MLPRIQKRLKKQKKKGQDEKISLQQVEES